MDVTVGRHRFAVVNDEYGPFWQRVSARDWEPDSFAVLDHFLTATSTFLDVGAWIGPLTLYAARLAGACHAIEPDERARACLAANISVNPDLMDRITIHPVAIAESAGPGRLGSVTSRVGGDSMSSLLYSDAPATWPVDCVTLEDFVGILGPDAVRLDLVKLDIEGTEVEVLSGSRHYLQRNRPPLFVSVHARFWADPLPRLERLLDVLSCYHELLTPRLVPLDRRRLLDADHQHGLFELVAI